MVGNYADVSAHFQYSVLHHLACAITDIPSAMVRAIESCTLFSPVQVFKEAGWLVTTRADVSAHFQYSVLHHLACAITDIPSAMVRAIESCTLFSPVQVFKEAGRLVTTRTSVPTSSTLCSTTWPVLSLTSLVLWSEILRVVRCFLLCRYSRRPVGW